MEEHAWPCAAKLELQPVNLTVGPVNTMRTPGNANAGRSASSAFDASIPKHFELPWTPDTAVLSPLTAAGQGHLPLFQPSPRRYPLCSPAGHNFGFTTLEAMLHSPIYSSLGDPELGCCFDTPSSMSALQSIFATTPQNKHDSQPQMQSSDSKLSQRGFVDLAKIHALMGQQERQQQGQQQALDLKQDSDAVHVAPATSLSLPDAPTLETLLRQRLQGTLQHGDSLSPGAMFLMNPFYHSLDADAVHQQLQQSQPISTSLPMLTLSMPSRGLVVGGGHGTQRTGLDSAAFNPAQTCTVSNTEDALLDLPPLATSSMAVDPKTDSDNSQGSVPSSQVLGGAVLASSQGKADDPNEAKTCHCKKSRCLKLYCDCFAAGLFCANCACASCLNTPEHGEVVMERRDLITSRDPQAFSNKILAMGAKQGGTHKRGCQCKRSFCLKKYCECFQGGVKCGNQCKCLDCKNLEDAPAPPGGRGSGAAKAKAKGVKASDTQLLPADMSSLKLGQKQAWWHTVTDEPIQGSMSDPTWAVAQNKKWRLVSTPGDAIAVPPAAPEPTVVYCGASGTSLQGMGGSPIEWQVSEPVPTTGCGAGQHGAKTARHHDTTLGMSRALTLASNISSRELEDAEELARELTKLTQSQDHANLTREIEAAVAARRCLQQEANNKANVGGSTERLSSSGLDPNPQPCVLATAPGSQQLTMTGHRQPGASGSAAPPAASEPTCTAHVLLQLQRVTPGKRKVHAIEYGDNSAPLSSGRGVYSASLAGVCGEQRRTGALASSSGAPASSTHIAPPLPPFRCSMSSPTRSGPPLPLPKSHLAQGDEPGSHAPPRAMLPALLTQQRSFPAPAPGDIPAMLKAWTNGVTQNPLPRQSLSHSAAPSAGALSSFPISLPFPPPLIDSLALSVKAPTPRQTPPASDTASMLPATASMALFEEALKAASAMASMSPMCCNLAMGMSPTASDGFDPVQMLRSPMCSDAHQASLFTSSPMNSMFMSSPSKSMFMPSPTKSMFMPSPTKSKSMVQRVNPGHTALIASPHNEAKSLEMKPAVWTVTT